MTVAIVKNSFVASNNTNHVTMDATKDFAKLTHKHPHPHPHPTSPSVTNTQGTHTHTQLHKASEMAKGTTANTHHKLAVSSTETEMLVAFDKSVGD